MELKRLISPALDRKYWFKANAEQYEHDNDGRDQKKPLKYGLSMRSTYLILVDANVKKGVRIFLMFKD